VKGKGAQDGRFKRQGEHFVQGEGKNRCEQNSKGQTSLLLETVTL